MHRQAVALPTLLVVHLGENEVFIGPDLHAGTRQGDGFLAVGAHLGTSLALGRRVYLTLESGLVSSVVGPHSWVDPETDKHLVLTVGRVTSEVAVSVSWGSPYAPRVK